MTKKVLVIDNDTDTLDTLERKLRDRGMVPVVLRRGVSAKQKVKDEKPGAVVMELTLPDQDGRAVIRELKDDWEAKKVPIVVLSNYPNRIDHATREKVAGVFAKPADFEEVFARLQRAMAEAEKS